MIKFDKKDLNLTDTITCGQIFRYELINNKYYIILSDRIIDLYEDNKYIYVSSNEDNDLENVVMHYFDMNRNYNTINEYLINRDSNLKSIIDDCIGFKIINQNPFETMISYIISANNNVRNIKNSVDLIAKKYGKKVLYNNIEFYLFPTLEEIKNASIDDLNTMKLGFRSKYVYEFINSINTDKIKYINTLNTSDAIKYLMSFKGIGLKVASCILLFSYERLDVFPIDTWVKKIMSERYNIVNIKDIEKFSKEKFGDYSGIFIQYMFHSKRNKKNI